MPVPAVQGTMDRFASNTVNNVDSKGRVSVPASFRAVLKKTSKLHALMSVDHTVVEVGGEQMMALHEQRLERLDPLSPDYEIWTFYLLGDGMELKLDTEGRIQLNDRIREQTGITDKVLFEGRGLSFWLWEPGKYEAYRTEARAKVREMRRNLGSASGATAQGGREPGA